jgi:hypothetical protein
MAERVGFEPTVPFSTSVFKTGALNRALPPLLIWMPRQVSNLNSSESKSDVLPITPRGNGTG